MPKIVELFGLEIKMHMADHLPPHIHVIRENVNCRFDLNKMCFMDKGLSSRDEKLVTIWVIAYRDELLEMWNSQKIHKLTPLLKRRT